MMIDEEARYGELPMEEPTLELKTLPSTLKYTFLDDEKAKLVIISSKLVWEAVKEEILKWLNAEIIYPISDSFEESRSNGHDEREGWRDPNTTSDEMESLHRLLEVELCHEKRPLPSPIHPPNPRPTGMIKLLLLPWQIFGLKSECYSSQRSREGNIHMSVWHLCIQTHAIWTVQRPCNFLTMHDGNLLRLSWRQFRSFHGWLQCLWKWFWELSCSPDENPGGMRQEMTSVKLGKIPPHGTRGTSAWAYRLGQRTRGGQGQDRGHKKPPSTRYR